MRTKIFTFITLFTLICSCNKKIEIDNKKVFKLNRYDNISSLDPINARSQANNWACNLIYNSLVKIDSDLSIKPDIAKSWRISDNGKTYTFFLRKNVYFHKHPSFGKDSTRTVKADDFIFSFDRLKDINSNAAGSWIMNNIFSYKAINDTILEIKLKKSYPAFLGLISMKYASVIPKELFRNGDKEFTNHPIGTGPFQFKIWENNVKIVFRKNPLYFEFDNRGNRLPYLEAVNISFLPEKNSEFLELIKGNLDMMAGLDPSYKDEILTTTGELSPNYSKKIKILKAPYLSTVYLCFYLEGKKSVDIRIRQALNYGVNKNKIIKYMLKGQATAADGGIIPKGLPGYSSQSGYPYNPNIARELVNSYIKDNGQIASIQLITVQEYVAICEYIAAEMEKIGLPIKVNVVPGSSMLEGKATGKFMLFRANWGADYPDAENFLSLFYSKNFAPDGPNYSHYSSPEFDKLYENIFFVNNNELRIDNYKKMDALMMEKAPILPLFYDQTTLFINKNVRNFYISPIKLLDLTRVYKE